MGHKDPGAQTGESLTSVCVLGTRVLCFNTRLYSLCSTTAESAARLCVENAALNAPRTQLWALSSQCGCATPALIPSKKKSESRDFLHFIKVGHVSMCTCLFLCLCLCHSRTALATFHEGKHNISHMDMDPVRSLMVTCGSDRIVKVSFWSAPKQS